MSAKVVFGHPFCTSTQTSDPAPGLAEIPTSLVLSFGASAIEASFCLLFQNLACSIDNVPDMLVFH